MLLKKERTVAQTIVERPVYHMNDLSKITGSRATAYRILSRLREAGFAEHVREGHFTLRSSLFQPFNLWHNLLPSLQALKQARFLGLPYNENDVSLPGRVLKVLGTDDDRGRELT